MNNSICDLGVSIGKLGIENSNLSRGDKEFAKFGIDLLGEALKSSQPQPAKPFTVYGLALTTIQKIKTTAAQCSVEKIVLFPVFYTNGGYVIMIRVYGKDKEKIFNSLNFYPLYNIAESNMIEIDRFEKEIGVIIYEKD